MIDIENIKFRSLIGEEYADLANYLHEHPEALERYATHLVGELAAPSMGDIIDAEHVYIISLQHFNHFPRALLDELVRLVDSLASREIAEQFKKNVISDEAATVEPNQPTRLGRPTARPRPKRPPTVQSYNVIKSQMPKLPFRDVQKQIVLLANQHLIFTESTGDAATLAKFTGAACHDLLLHSTRFGVPGLVLVQDLVVGALRWQPFNPVLWNLWARAYCIYGDNEAAEYILWESIRRLPYSDYNSSVLAEILAHNKHTTWAAKVLEQAIVYSPQNFVLWHQLARVWLKIVDKDSIDRAIVAAQQSAQLNGGPRSKWLWVQLLGNNQILKKSSEHIVSAIKGAEQNDIWFSDIVTFLATQTKTRSIARDIADAAALAFPESPRAQNIRAKIIARNGDNNSLDQAIVICRNTIANIEDNSYSRMQLVEYLLAKGDRASVDEAARELAEREARFGIDVHSQRLRQRLAPSEENTNLNRRSVSHLARPRIAQFAHDEWLRQIKPIKKGAESMVLALPRFAKLGGQLRRYDFALSMSKNGGGGLVGDKSLAQIIATDPTFAYAQLLAERHAIWQSTSRQLEAFPVSFEKALRTSDVDLLNRLEKSMPRLDALCIIARCAVGDEKAFDQIAGTLSTIKDSGFPPLVALHKGIDSALKGSGERTVTEGIRSIERDRLIRILQSANEATIF